MPVPPECERYVDSLMAAKAGAGAAQGPLLREYWSDQREGFGKSFRDLVDREIAASGD